MKDNFIAELVQKTRSKLDFIFPVAVGHLWNTLKFVAFSLKEVTPSRGGK